MKWLVLAAMLAAPDGMLMFSEQYECPGDQHIEKRLYQTDKGPLITVGWVNGDGTLMSIQFSLDGFSPETVTLSRPGLPPQHMTFEELTSRYANPCLTLPGAPGERA